MQTIGDFPLKPGPELVQCITGHMPLRSRKRVLLVEDNPITQVVMLQMLEFLGFASEATASGIEAIDIIKREHFDLVLMDCRLPYMDGYDTTRLIRLTERHFELRPVAIVAVTGDDDVECIDRCLSAGMDGHLAKPVKISVLNRLLERFVR